MSNILNTLLLFEHAYEDTTWSCIVLHSKGGYSSVQKMVEDVAQIFYKVVNDSRQEYYGAICCSLARRRGLKKCDRCKKSTKVPPITERELADEFRKMSEGTMQNYGSEMWDALQNLGIESFGFKGNAGQTVSLYYAAELIAKTVFDEFKVEFNDYVHRCHSIPLYSKEVKDNKK